MDRALSLALHQGWKLLKYADVCVRCLRLRPEGHQLFQEGLSRTRWTCSMQRGVTHIPYIEYVGTSCTTVRRRHTSKHGTLARLLFHRTLPGIAAYSYCHPHRDVRCSHFTTVGTAPTSSCSRSVTNVLCVHTMLAEMLRAFLVSSGWPKCAPTCTTLT